MRCCFVSWGTRNVTGRELKVEVHILVLLYQNENTMKVPRMLPQGKRY